MAREEEEPEPGPREEASATSCVKVLNDCISRCLKTHYQMLQLAAEVASVACYFSSCAPYFLKLAEQAKLQAGVLMDLVISLGGSIKLPALDSPCCNLSYDKEDCEPTLLAALEACLQLESSKSFASLHREVRGNAMAHRVIEAMTVDSAQKQEELARLLSTLLQARTKLEALAHMRAATLAR